MDELAHAVNMDPLEFRLKNLKDDRLRAVLESAAKAFGWGALKASAITDSASPWEPRRAHVSPLARKLQLIRKTGYQSSARRHGF